MDVSIVGASGYAGGELLRLLLDHPQVRVKQATSEHFAGQPVYFVHPNLRGRTDLQFVRLADLEPCDVLFIALPHGLVAPRIGEFASVAERLVDLSADFRLRDPADYPRWYGWEHPAPEWLPRFVYGLPELHREEICNARYVSGVGCNAAVVILALWPLYQAGLVERAVVEVKVGSSEGGAEPTPASHHPERSHVVRSYAPAGHRHMAELIQELTVDGQRPEIYLSITSVELVRGALATAHCFLSDDLPEREVWQLYRRAYGGEPFIRLVRSAKGIYRFPEPKILAGSNYCDIGFVLEPGTRRLVVIAAIDNLMKGAAGTAVQAMNLMCGFPETMGLEFPGLHPI
uniref:N-acetyl-gamma-glutamyl-phosphate reductase n=1 Tax=uncultured prokaryote TaxID=198431 RepID=H5SKB2_9ZZZZ|nr:N-acetyl-gamma-glutamyl-phosphate reductase [uncultured prokaryote]